MRLVIPVLILISLICLSRIARAADSGAIQIKELSYDYGGLNGFYSIGYHISMGLVPTLSDPVLKKIADIVTNHGGDISDVANDVVQAYAGPIVFMVFGGVLALAAAISCLVICCGRCFCKCCGVSDYQPSNESRTTLYISAALLFASFAFVLTGAIIYGLAVNDTYKTLNDEAYSDITGIISDMEKLINNTKDQINDSVDKYVNKAFDDTQAVIDAAPASVMNSFEDSIGLTTLNNESTARNQYVDDSNRQVGQSLIDLNAIEDLTVDNEVKDLEGKVTAVKNANLGLASIQTLLDQVNDHVKGIQGQLDDALKDANKVIDDTRKEVISTTSDITNAINDVHDQLRKVENTTQKWIYDVKDWNGLKAFRSGLQAIGLFPLSIALFLMLIGIIAAVARITRSRVKPHQRSTQSHIAGGCSVAGIYIGFVVSALLMAFAVIVFFGGFVVSSVCKPLFRDDTYALYRSSDDFVVKVDPYGKTDNPIATNIGEIFEQCDEKTMFALIGGDEIIKTSDVMNSINFADIETQALAVIPDPFWPANLPDPNIAIAALDAWQQSVGPIKDAQDFLKNTVDAHPGDQRVATAITDLKTLQDTLKKLSSILDDHKNALQNFRTYTSDETLTHTTITKEVNVTFTSVESTTSKGIDNFIDALLTNVAECRPFLTVYGNVGVLVCDHIGRPVHGIWAALGLAALALIPAGFSFLLLVRWLLRMDRHYYRDDSHDSSSMIWAGSGAPPPRIIHSPPTDASFSAPQDRLSEDHLDIDASYNGYPSDGYSGSTGLRRPNTIYPELGLPRVSRYYKRA